MSGIYLLIAPVPVHCFSITLVRWGKRANLSASVYPYLCGFCLERVPLPLGAWDGLRYFIVALPEPSINYLVKRLKTRFFLHLI